MSWIHTTAIGTDNAPISGNPAGAVQTTRAYDTALLFAGSFSFTLAGATGTPSIALAMQGSNAVPPNGTVNAGRGYGDPWAPPESSWAAIGSTPITGTITTNGTTVLFVPGTVLLTRWVRAVATPTGNSGGTMLIEIFMRDTGS